MSSKIYVGNISFNTSEEDLKNVFTSFGDVVSVNIITDRETGRSKGFGFVELSSPDAAKAAIAALNGKEVDGRQLRVNEAQDRPKKERTRW